MESIEDIVKKIKYYIENKPEEMQDWYNKGSIYVENYKKYNATSWYDWRCNNWGVKWNASDSDVTDADDENYYISFSTPWGPPDGWIKELAKNGIPFSVIWEEESGYRGKYECMVNRKTTELADMECEVSYYPDSDNEEEWAAYEHHNELAYDYPVRITRYKISGDRVIDVEKEVYTRYTLEEAKKQMKGIPFEYKRIS